VWIGWKDKRAWQGLARRGWARHCGARLGEAGQGRPDSARLGEAWQGKAGKQLNVNRPHGGNRGAQKGKAMTEQTQITTADHEADALPQARGFYRPSMGKTLMHTEKRGPAFTAQAEAIRAVGDVLFAMTRSEWKDAQGQTVYGPVFDDAMPAWDRALAAMGYHWSKVALTGITLTSNSDILHSIIAAMQHTGITTIGESKWRNADAAMRGMAVAHAAKFDLFASSTRAAAWEEQRDEDADMIAEIAGYERKAAQLRAWAGVR